MSLAENLFDENHEDFGILNDQDNDLPLSLAFNNDKKPRWYQKEIVSQVEQALLDNFKRLLIVSPTGSGKTFTCKLIVTSNKVRELLNIPKKSKIRVLYLAHMNRLLDQAEEYYDEKSNVELIRQSVFSDINEETMKKGWDLCVIDEAHHEPMNSIQYHLENLSNKPIIGMTATPDRGDGLLLKFDKKISVISRKQAVAQGFLAETKLNTVIDTSGVDKTEILYSLMYNFSQEMNKTIAFVRTRREAKLLSEIANKLGKTAVCLLDQKEHEMSKILDDFSLGKIDFIANCSKINEGVDVVGCDNIILGKKYNSYNEINQAIGRGARPDSDCNVWQLSNPISKQLDARKVVGDVPNHRIIELFGDKYKIAS